MYAVAFAFAQAAQSEVAMPDSEAKPGGIGEKATFADLGVCEARQGRVQRAYKFGELYINIYFEYLLFYTYFFVTWVGSGPI